MSVPLIRSKGERRKNHPLAEGHIFKEYATSKNVIEVTRSKPRRIQSIILGG